MRTTPGVILILKQAPSAARLHKILAQKLVLTVVAGCLVEQQARIDERWDYSVEINDNCSGLIGQRKKSTTHKWLFGAAISSVNEVPM